MNKPVIDLVAGARPNFMKVAPVYHALKASGSAFVPRLIHTGQHYDKMLSDIFFTELGLPKPDFHLGIDGGSPADQTGRIIQAYDNLLAENPPAMTVVVGDVNSTVACSLAAAHRGVPLVHLEAGLRSFDRTMPEEINRVVTDSVADLLLTPSSDADDHLRCEGIPASRIRFVGNIMIDSLDRLVPKALESDVLAELALKKHGFALVTLHRPASVDDPTVLGGLLSLLAELSAKIPMVLPAHPRLKKNLEQLDGRILEQIQHSKNFRLIEPLGYLDFIALEASARVVLTDSGGVQEETTVLGVPCLTLRDTTERPVTVSEGTNRVVGHNRDRIVHSFEEVLALPMPESKRPPLWDGHTAERVVKALESFFRNRGVSEVSGDIGDRVRAFTIPCCEAHRSPDVRRELLLVAETGDWQAGPSIDELAARVGSYAGAPKAVMCGDIAGGLAALRAGIAGGPVGVLGGWVPDDVAAVLNGMARNWENLESPLPSGCRLVYVPPVIPGEWAACQPERIVAWAKEHPEIVVAVDERWYEYSQDSVTALLHTVPNVVALRSLGPAFGLQGLNIGYLISARDGMAATARAVAQAGILPVALRAASAAMLDQGYMKEYVDTRAATRRWLTGKLAEIGYDVTELPGPYLFIKGAMPDNLGEASCTVSTAEGWLWAIGTPEQVEDAFTAFEVEGREVKT